jgi:hypothetical protein
VLAQSAALAVAEGVHWMASAALLLAPPCVGFVLLASFVAEVTARSARAARAGARERVGSRSRSARR